MTGKELGTILGDAIAELQNASMEIEETVGMLLSIDGMAIVPNGAEDDVEENQPRMTVEELGELLGDVLSVLETATAGVEGVGDMLRSIDGVTFASSEAYEAAEVDE